MGRRFFKVLVIIGYLIIIGSIISGTFEVFYDGEDVPQIVALVIGLSTVPLALLMVVQYVVFGSLSLSYVFKNKKFVLAVVKMILVFFAVGIVFAGVALKNKIETEAFRLKYQQIRNDTFVDYNRKDHRDFREVEHEFLHKLAYSPRDVNMTMVDELSDEALSIAVNIQSNQKEREKRMRDLAMHLGYKSIGTDEDSVRWVETIEGKFYRWDYALVKKGKQ